MKLVYNGYGFQKWRLLEDGCHWNYNTSKGWRNHIGLDANRRDLFDSHRREAMNGYYIKTMNVIAESAQSYYQIKYIPLNCTMSECLICGSFSKKGVKMIPSDRKWCIDCVRLVDNMIKSNRLQLIHLVFSFKVPRDIARVILMEIWRVIGPIKK